MCILLDFMKVPLNLILLFLIFACSSPVTRNNASIAFNTQEYDFGAIPLKKEADYSFNFSNPGKTPLMINNVKPSCGCTAVEWTRAPVKPGKQGTITVRYDAASPGIFHKEIAVYYNGPGSPVILKIKGKTEYPDL
jgi:hypothetical protein